ncbi:DNA cytosine methyltransferase [Hyphococcus lacteus]|uniref:Cytosine-specific methyltransferase n=1 Tax=Hyphococcus lacteus TaxID=3143536 RepID=A0ABV3Z3U6_9PROT
MNSQRTFLEFFAGGGMARIGLGDQWRCLFANDIDTQKCAAYRENFGNKDLIEGDINDLSTRDLPADPVDLIWASFPCQDLSLAGERGGIHAARSGMFFPFWSRIEELIASARAPKIIAIENVTGLLTSNNGHDFATVIECMTQNGYRTTACVLDAKSFTPQSRPRLFILGFADEVTPPLSDTPPSQALAPPAMISALEYLSPQARMQWVWLAKTPTPLRQQRLSDLVDWDADNWHSQAQTEHLLNMMSASQRERVNALIRNGARRAGTAFRRTRTENGRSVQRVEARFDGLAGCLRTPAGGSSRQLIFAVENGTVRSRLMSPIESARLMGLPEEYRLPANNTAALKLIGDGVCVPVVQWLAEEIFEPSLASKRARNAA